MRESLLDQKTCRICLEDDTTNNLIYPCKCSGTSKYVHKYCLNQWRTLSENREAYYKCFECNYYYKLEATVENQYNNNNLLAMIKYLKSNMIIFLLFNMTLIFILATFIANIDNNYNIIKFIYGIVPTTMSKITSSSIYMCVASIIYILLVIIGLGINIMYMKNKMLYLKYFCKKKSLFAIIVLIFTVILVMFNIVIGTVILTLILQIIFNYHLQTMEKIKQENMLKIFNYGEGDYDEEDIIENNIMVNSINDEDNVNIVENSSTQNIV